MLYTQGAASDEMARWPLCQAQSGAVCLLLYHIDIMSVAAATTHWRQICASSGDNLLLEVLQPLTAWRQELTLFSEGLQS